MRTLILGMLFALAPVPAEKHYSQALQLVAEASQTVNAVRLIVLGWQIGEELEETVRLDPEHLAARMDLVRYYLAAPRLIGGGRKKAGEQAVEIARRDVSLGHFAAGYIAYRGDKDHDRARKELRLAVRTAKKASARTTALMWLGWLSQETQNYDEAFASFEKILEIDPSRLAASYEIGRTSVFCQCRIERGEEALLRYMLSAAPTGEMPKKGEAEKLLAKLRG